MPCLSSLTSAPIDVDAILATSRRNNVRDTITGFQIYDGKRFLQASEGYGPLVEAAFTWIKADPRHRAAVMSSFRQVCTREFRSWNTACQKVAPILGARELGDVVDALPAQVPDPSTRAQFNGFAMIKRQAA